VKGQNEGMNVTGEERRGGGSQLVVILDEQGHKGLCAIKRREKGRKEK